MQFGGNLLLSRAVGDLTTEPYLNGAFAVDASDIGQRVLFELSEQGDVLRVHHRQRVEGEPVFLDFVKTLCCDLIDLNLWLGQNVLNLLKLLLFSLSFYENGPCILCD